MTPQEYQRACDLFDQIHDLSDSERQAALEMGCAGNAQLRARVERMLAADRRADGGAFLARRAIEDAARLAVPAELELPSPGTVLGNYRLNARIGAGGMGVVYEAEDLRLHRSVAVKVLPLPFAA